MTRKNILFYSSILINLVIAILGSIAIITQFFVTETYNAVDTGGINIFRFFTNDGNIICILVSYISLFFLLRKLFNKDKPLPKFIYPLKLISAVTGAIIFLVVFLILGPLMGGLQMMISGFRMSVLHVVNPILCVLSFLVLEENENKKSKRHALIGASAVYVYGFISILLVLFRVWENQNIPYPFLRVYDNPLWQTILYFTVILGGAYGLSLLFQKLQLKLRPLVFGK